AGIGPKDRVAEPSWGYSNLGSGLVKATLAARLDRRARLAIDFALLERLALVELLLAFRKAHGHLDAAALEVEPDRHQRHALHDRLADQLADLVAVQQQLAPAQRLVIRIAAMAVGADVDVVEIDLIP